MVGVVVAAVDVAVAVAVAVVVVVVASAAAAMFVQILINEIVGKTIYIVYPPVYFPLSLFYLSRRFECHLFSSLTFSLARCDLS